MLEDATAGWGMEGAPMNRSGIESGALRGKPHIKKLEFEPE